LSLVEGFGKFERKGVGRMTPNEAVMRMGR
jgi:hypothetical protein